MKIRRGSLLARAYFLLEEDKTKSVTLCQLVGKVFIALPIISILATGILVVAALPLGIEWCVERWRVRHGPSRPSALMEWVRAKKRGVCPMVEFD